MEIIFSRKKPKEYVDESWSKNTRPGIIVINKLVFCCEEMADEVTQKPCSLSTDNPNEIWFHGAGELEYYARFCPFCGKKIIATELGETIFK